MKHQLWELADMEGMSREAEDQLLERFAAGPPAAREIPATVQSSG